ncbi:MAG: hypothetical protein M3522_03270 [Actinomycetota bacterium]|jgi:hypothetical protein|nr:hypothetical protein [Actinomycetota bacterium]
MSALFEVGAVVATPGAIETIGHEGCLLLLRRHASGDWGDLGDFDRRQNGQALRDGARLLSAYDTEAGRCWIITEADRTSTCVLLPSEY